MWKVTIETEERERTVVALKRVTYAIGRAEGSDIRLTERDVSRRQAQLRLAGRSYVLSDAGSAGSTNGVFLDGERLTRHQPVAAGDLVRIVTSRASEAARYPDTRAGCTKTRRVRARRQRGRVHLRRSGFGEGRRAGLAERRVPPRVRRGVRHREEGQRSGRAHRRPHLRGGQRGRERGGDAGPGATALRLPERRPIWRRGRRERLQRAP